MNSFVALFRGINVGGRNRLPMKGLVAVMDSLGAENVKTYIQSGNAVFQSMGTNRRAFAEKLTSGIQKEYGFSPHVLVLELDAIVNAMANNPFPEAEVEPKNLHLGFLSSVPQCPDLEKFESLKKRSERFRLIGSIFYLHAPEGVGRSRLAAASERLLGVPMTDRNWKTVCKIREMAS